MPVNASTGQKRTSDQRIRSHSWGTTNTGTGIRTSVLCNNSRATLKHWLVWNPRYKYVA